MLGEHIVEAVIPSHGLVINPITVSGTIYAAGPDGTPVYSAAGNMWILDIMLLGYAKYAPSAALSYAFPETAQKYYNVIIEPLMNAAAPYLRGSKATFPTPVIYMILVGLDAAIAAGFFAYAAGFKALIALGTVALVRKVRAGGK